MSQDETSILPRDPAPADTEESAVDLHSLNAALKLNIGELAPKLAESDAASILPELADDMLEVLRRMQAIEETQQRLASQMAQVHGAVQGQSRDLSNLRQEIGIELRVNAVAAVLRGVVPILNTLANARKGLHPKKDDRFIKQIEALRVELDTVLNSLGCATFTPRIGEPFNPATMEVSGYAKGDRGIVLAIDRPGYFVANRVIRNAGVKIADPTKTV
jgi:molecular chaperone GrpE (heat shock protein)